MAGMAIDMLLEKIKRPGLYTLKVNDKLEFESVTLDMAGKYITELNNKLEITSMYHDKKLMTNRSGLNPAHNDYIDPNDKYYKPQNFERDPADKDKVIVPPKLKHGCVGLGLISESSAQTDPCRLIWGTWW